MPAVESLSYTFNSVKHEIVCDVDAISGLPAILQRAGASRAMVLCGPSILAHCDVVPRVQQALGDQSVGLFSGVAPHSPVPTLDAAVDLARETGADALVSVGGGSTHDTTKGVATLLAEGGRIHDWEAHFEPPNRITYPTFSSQRLPIITVTTTMGAAELSRGAGFADRDLGRKILVADPNTIPGYIVIDGKALATTPVNILTSTAMGQLRIAIETIYSTAHNPISDGMALHAIRLLAENLPHCHELDVERLLLIKTAASMASLGNTGGLGLNTATAHHVGGIFDVPHGEANAIMLPHTMRYNSEACPDRLAMIADAMGIDITAMTDMEAAHAAADGVENLRRSLGLPDRLRDVGVPEEGLELIASATLHDRALATNPRPVTDAGPIMTVLRDSW